MTLQEIKTANEVNLSDVFLPKQREASQYLVDDVTVEVLYGGAAGGGKSLFGGLWLAINCLKYPGTRWVMGRSKLKTLKETTLATFFEVTNALSWAGLFEYKEQKGKIVWKNGSEIILRDLFFYPSDPEFDSLGSLEITGAFVDECSQITHKAKSILRSRIRFKLTEFGLIPKMLLTCNPSKNWVYSEFYLPFKKGEIPKDRAFVPAKVTDNPYLPGSYIESLQKLPEASKQRLLHGNFEYDDDPDALIEYDAMCDMFENDFIARTGDRCMTADVALQGSDKMVIGIWDGFVLTNIYEFQKTDGKEVLDNMKSLAKKHRIPNSRIVYDADGVGGFLRGFLKGAKPFVNNSTPVKVKGKPENYENLKSQCEYRISERINNREIYVSHNCPEEIQDIIKEELGQIKRRDADKDGKMKVLRKEERKLNLGRSPDYSDMIMMREYLELKKSKKSKSIIIS